MIWDILSIYNQQKLWKWLNHATAWLYSNGKSPRGDESATGLSTFDDDSESARKVITFAKKKWIPPIFFLFFFLSILSLLHICLEGRINHQKSPWKVALNISKHCTDFLIMTIVIYTISFFNFKKIKSIHVVKNHILHVIIISLAWKNYKFLRWAAMLVRISSLL